MKSEPSSCVEQANIVREELQLPQSVCREELAIEPGVGQP